MTETTRKDSVAGNPDTGSSGATSFLTHKNIASSLHLPGLWQWRYVQVMLMLAGFSLAYALRVCITLAMVAMMDDEEYREVYDNMSTIQSSFFWGYIVTQVPAAQLAKFWSASNILTIGIGLCAVLSLLTPLAADAGWLYVCACRATMGLLQGCIFPCMHTLLASWAPPAERARLVTLTYLGPFSGTVLSNALSGVLAESPAGWPSMFYVFGAISLLWAALFILLGADSPGKHRWISAKEKRYIESSLGGDLEEKKFDKETQGANKTPWREILSSVPVWAMVVAHCGQNWGFWVIMNEISIFMRTILNFNLHENGVGAALPYLTVMVLAFPVSWLSDYALKKGVRKVVLRKVANTIAQWGAALALVGLCLAGSGDKNLAVGIFVLAVGANVGASCGFQMNHMDISPNNAGILMSITNGIASVVGIIVPPIVNEIVTDLTDFSQWQILFYLTAGVYFVSNLIFLILGTTKRQWWDDPEIVEAKRNKELDVTATP